MPVDHTVERRTGLSHVCATFAAMDIAIVGRPNVGKSALFNRLAGRRIAIVHDQPGITRDRISATCQIGGKTVRLWDTGGIAGAGETQLTAEVQAEAARAMKESDLILLVMDGQDGLNPMDRELARRVRKLQKPVLILVNKIDDPKHEARVDEFSALGFGNAMAISAAHGRGMTELRQKIDGFLGPSKKAEHRIPNTEHGTPNGQIRGTEQPVAIAMVGRPNAGKSSLINALLRDRRTIVSEIPGTTRDSIDIEYERDGRRYLFIDTAGIRQRSRHSSSVEVFSVMRAERTIARADICVLVVDAAEGIKAQDRRVAALIQKARKACVVVLNKWDLARHTVIPNVVERSRKRYSKASAAAFLDSTRNDRVAERKGMESAISHARAELFFIDYAPVLVTSALTREHATRLFKMMERIRRAGARHVGTGKLNRALRAAFAANPPPMVKGNRLKLFYAAQSGGDESRPLAPAEFVLFVNSPRLLTQPYARFLEAKIREIEPYPGLPVLLRCRPRSEKL
jgi:GTPase